MNDAVPGMQGDHGITSTHTLMFNHSKEGYTPAEPLIVNTDTISLESSANSSQSVQSKLPSNSIVMGSSKFFYVQGNIYYSNAFF